MQGTVRVCINVYFLLVFVMMTYGSLHSLSKAPESTIISHWSVAPSSLLKQKTTVILPSSALQIVSKVEARYHT